MLPHIVFNPSVNDYSPGPEFWHTDLSPHARRDPLTSGIMQSPVHSTAVRHIYEHGENRQSARKLVEDMYTNLKAWHEYMFKYHQPDGDGLIYIRHHWGSGQDNSPIWDRILDRIKLNPEDIPEYRRVDKDIAESDDRPREGEIFHFQTHPELRYL
jgi:hypothetical protein